MSKINNLFFLQSLMLALVKQDERRSHPVEVKFDQRISLNRNNVT